METERPAVVAIFGPTASGKTELAVEVARMLGTAVVNADPAQCYDGLPILTNKPEPRHDAIAPHHMVGCWGLSEVASIHRYADTARPIVDALVRDHGAAVVAGGSGLYHAAVLRALSFGERRSGLADGRNRWDVCYEEDGPAGAHARLAALDPSAAARIHPNDRKRLVRALELAETRGTVDDGPGLWDAPYRHATCAIGIDCDADRLRERIDRRTAAMFEAGVVEEVAAVIGEQGEDIDTALSITSRRIHGVPEIAACLAGQSSRTDAIDRLAANTRRYAKRQRTWMRRWPGLVPVQWEPDVTPPGEIATLVREMIEGQRADAARGQEPDALQQVARHRQ